MKTAQLIEPVGAPAIAFPRVRSRTATPSRPSPLYRPELDALRFFSFLMIFVFHGIGVQVQTGALHAHMALAYTARFVTDSARFGLPVFFFLSGYLITSLLMQERDRTETIHLKSFYVRRILRVWPLYLGCLFGAFLLGQFWAPSHLPAPVLLSFVLLSGNWYLLATGGAALVSMLWSVSIEEQFYLLWPLMVRRLSRRSIEGLCLGLIAVSLLADVLLAHYFVDIHVLWFHSASEMIFLASGGWFGLRFGLLAEKKSGAKALAAIALALLLAEAARACSGPGPAITPLRAPLTFLLMDLGAAALLWGFLRLPARWVRSQFVYLGRISYGLYVFHGLALQLGSLYGKRFIPLHLWLLVSLGVAVGMAALSYRYFEMPFLRLKYRFEWVHARTA